MWTASIGLIGNTSPKNMGTGYNLPDGSTGHGGGHIELCYAVSFSHELTKILGLSYSLCCAYVLWRSVKHQKAMFRRRNKITDGCSLSCKGIMRSKHLYCGLFPLVYLTMQRLGASNTQMGPTSLVMPNCLRVNRPAIYTLGMLPLTTMLAIVCWSVALWTAMSVAAPRRASHSSGNTGNTGSSFYSTNGRQSRHSDASRGSDELRVVTAKGGGSFCAMLRRLCCCCCSRMCGGRSSLTPSSAASGAASARIADATKLADSNMRANRAGSKLSSVGADEALPPVPPNPFTPTSTSTGLSPLVTPATVSSKKAGADGPRSDPHINPRPELGTKPGPDPWHKTPGFGSGYGSGFGPCPAPGPALRPALGPASGFGSGPALRPAPGPALGPTPGPAGSGPAPGFGSHSGIPRPAPLRAPSGAKSFVQGTGGMSPFGAAPAGRSPKETGAVVPPKKQDSGRHTRKSIFEITAERAKTKDSVDPSPYVPPTRKGQGRALKARAFFFYKAACSSTPAKPFGETPPSLRTVAIRIMLHYTYVVVFLVVWTYTMMHEHFAHNGRDNCIDYGSQAALWNTYAPNEIVWVLSGWVLFLTWGTNGNLWAGCLVRIAGRSEFWAALVYRTFGKWILGRSNITVNMEPPKYRRNISRNKRHSDADSRGGAGASGFSIAAGGGQSSLYNYSDTGLGSGAPVGDIEGLLVDTTVAADFSLRGPDDGTAGEFGTGGDDDVAIPVGPDASPGALGKLPRGIVATPVIDVPASTPPGSGSGSGSGSPYLVSMHDDVATPRLSELGMMDAPIVPVPAGP